jgi:hypothetical protein
MPKILRNLWNKSSTSSKIRYKQGTIKRVIKVAKSTPKPIAIAIGFKNCAWRLLSKRIGNSPTNVVSDVSKIGRNLAMPAFFAASIKL